MRSLLALPACSLLLLPPHHLVFTPSAPLPSLLQELDKQAEGYMIKSGIVIICRNATIKGGTVI